MRSPCRRSAVTEAEPVLQSTPPGSRRRVSGHPFDLALASVEPVDAPEAHAHLGVFAEPEQAACDCPVATAPTSGTRPLDMVAADGSSSHHSPPSRGRAAPDPTGLTMSALGRVRRDVTCDLLGAPRSTPDHSTPIDPGHFVAVARSCDMPLIRRRRSHLSPAIAGRSPSASTAGQRGSRCRSGRPGEPSPRKRRDFPPASTPGGAGRGPSTS
jgi:hypothetical protein